MRHFGLGVSVVLCTYAAGKAFSEQIPENCPGKREWTSAIAPENRPVF